MSYMNLFENLLWESSVSSLFAGGIGLVVKCQIFFFGVSRFFAKNTPKIIHVICFHNWVLRVTNFFYSLARFNLIRSGLTYRWKNILIWSALCLLPLLQWKLPHQMMTFSLFLIFTCTWSYSEFNPARNWYVLSLSTNFLRETISLEQIHGQTMVLVKFLPSGF